MKGTLRRLFCFFLVVCMCCSVLPLTVSVIADVAEPVLSDRYETVLENAGKDGSFGASASDLRTSTAIKFSSSKNLSDSDVFELNIYIENITALQSAVTDTQYVQFGFSSSSRRPTANHAEADITAQLTVSGWNSVIVKRADFVEHSINWSSVWYVFLRFADETVALPAALTDKTVKIRNICEAYAPPVVADDSVLLSDFSVISKLSDSASAPLSDIGETFFAEIDAADLSSAVLLKVDLLASDLALFQSFLADKQLRFVFTSTDGTAFCDFDGTFFPSATADWYTVQLPLGDFKKDEKFDFSDLTGFRIGITGDSATVGEAYAMRFGFANLRFAEVYPPEEVCFYGTVKEYYGVRDQAAVFGEKYTDLSLAVSSEFAPLIDAQNIEFYLYVENCERFRNSFLTDADGAPVAASLDLALSNGSGTLTWTGIEQKVIASGWNHILLPVSDAENQNFSYGEPFSGIGLTVSGADASRRNPNEGGMMILTQFVSTVAQAAPGTLQFEETAVLSEGTTALTATTYQASQTGESISLARNIRGADYLEFDIFIQNWDLFKTVSAQNNITDIALVLSSSPGNSAAAGFSEKMAHNGWNHIILPLNALLHGEVSGTIDLTNVSLWQVCFVGQTAASTGVFQNQKIAVKNLTATAASEPVLPADAQTVLSQAGASGTYGAGYSSLKISSEITLPGTTDLTGVGQIEFDFYAENPDNLHAILEENGKRICFGFGCDPDGQTVLLDFTNQIKSMGWNHIVLYPADLETVNRVFLTFDTEEGDLPYGYEPFRYRNIIAKDGDYKTVPFLPANTAGVVSEEGFTVLYGEDIPLTFSPKGGHEAKIELDTVVNLNGAAYIEFDIYVTDLELFKAYQDMYLSLYPKENPNNGYRADLSFVNQVTQRGWNHIRFKKTAARSRGASGSYPYNIDWSNVSAVALMTVNTGAPAVTGTGFAVIANICGTPGEGLCHSLDFGPFCIDFENGALIDGVSYRNNDLLNAAGVYRLTYTESEQEFDTQLVLYRLGDANCDDTANILDLIRMKKNLAGKGTLNAAGKEASDYTMDGEIAADDLVMMMENLLTDSAFPVTAYEAEDMEDLVDFTVEAESGKEIRVLQLSDTQIVESEQQRTSNRLSASLYKRWLTEKKDRNYRNCLRDVIGRYQPDLILITGDLIYGEFDDSGSALVEFVRFMDSFEIPWAPVFGNHENESHKGVDWQCKRLLNSDYCLFKQRELTGNGNYTVGIKQDGKYKRVFFMLDSNGCGNISAESLANGHSKKTSGFGDDQIEWYTSLSRKMRYAQPDVKLSAAFHIQLKVFAKAFAKYGFPDELPINIETAPNRAATDFGFIGAKLKGAWDGEENVWYSLKNAGFDSLFVGHEHSNSASVVYKGVRLQYGQKSSTYDRANYRGADGTITTGAYENSGTPIIGGTAIPVLSDGSIGKGELLLYEPS